MLTLFPIQGLRSSSLGQTKVISHFDIEFVVSLEAIK